jgi:cyclic pyranopterin phosphate synthase
MVDITSKSNTLREAIAQAVVKLSRQEALDALVGKTVPKGDVFEIARAAGLFAVKRTSDLIPDCHPLPIEYAAVSYEILGMEIHIRMEVKTVYKTGVEVEAMHGASVVALTVYDMLKPLDKGIEILQIRLLEKKGGKTDIGKAASHALRAAVVVISDSVSAGTSQDQSGLLITEKLKALHFENPGYHIVADTLKDIQALVTKLGHSGTDLIICTGGTGLSSRDVTPEAILPLIDREIPGLMETARAYGQERTPFAMLSRGVAGFMGKTLILTLPGSPKGVRESMEALFPQVMHVFALKEGLKHT